MAQEDQTTKEWLSSNEFAVLIGCTPEMVRWHLRQRISVVRGYAKKDAGGPWFIHRDAIQDQLVWAMLTGTSNRKSWGPAWQGSREGRRAELKRLRREATRSMKTDHAEQKKEEKA